MIRVLALVLLAQPAAAFEFPAPVRDGDYRATDPAVVAWGRLLFWDPILSGNRNISCGTCHHPLFGTGDGVSLGLGEGGIGLGPARVANPETPPERRMARNAPGLWNLGAREFVALFHDGRVEATADGLRIPFAPGMASQLKTVLEAQVLSPLVAAEEMAGQGNENPVAQAVRAGRITDPGGAFDLLSTRVAGVPEYVAMWHAAFPGDETLDIGDIARALAQFIEMEWRSDTAPFDRWLRGEATLPGRALEGAELFYGAARCGTCHAGPFLTDHAYHAMGQPQLGPGMPGREGRDEGRFLVTGQAVDRFAFRTPSLRNVTDTGPWGHAGAYDNLREFVRDHAAPRGALTRYRRMAVLPDFDAGDQATQDRATQDWAILDDPEEVTALRAAVRGPDLTLTEAEVTALMAFLETLRDAAAFDRQDPIPRTVPSGLPVDRD